MNSLSVFNFITLNGFYSGPGGDIGWQRHGGEESQFSEEGLKTGNILLFGRITYDMMAAFWPTENARNMFPEVARGMNNAQKIVFSRSMNDPEWQNTRVIQGNLVDETRRLKEGAGKNMTILGSGSIVTQCAEAGLIDEYQFMIDPVMLGQGSTICSGISKRLDLALVGARTFQSGVVLLTYVPL